MQVHEGKMDIGTKSAKGKTMIMIKIEKDDALAGKIIENIQENVWLDKCHNCGKLFIVNSATHRICWRCREKDRTESSPVEL